MVHPEIRIKVEGQGVSPETVQWVDSREIINGFYSAVLATAGASGIPRSDVQFAVSDIERGRRTAKKGGVEVIEITTDPATHTASQPLIEAISSRDDSRIVFEAREGLERAHRPLRKWSWQATVSRNGSPDTRAVMLPTAPLFDPPRNVLRGNSSLLVQVVSVGGVKPTAKLRLANGHLIIAPVASRVLAAELATKLYKTIQVHGEIVWDIATKGIRHVRVTGVGNYIREEADPISALKDLHKLSGGYWDTVSPDEFLKDIRGK